MKIKNNKIIEATEAELFGVYLKGNWDEIMSFPDYMSACIHNGTKIIGETNDENL